MKVPEGVTLVLVDDSRYALALLSAAWFDYPAEKIEVIGITGTKGKTTTTFMVKGILEHAGYKVGLMGTIEIIIGEEHIPACKTTRSLTSFRSISHGWWSRLRALRHGSIPLRDL